MRYLFLDRIQRLEVNKQVLATKNVALSEDVFVDHFVGSPVLPGALLIEALAQAGTALLEVSANFRKKALLVMVEQAKFRVLVQPGDQLSISAEILSIDRQSAQIQGKIHVADRLVMSAHITFSLKDAEEFYPSKTRHLMETIYDYWLKDAEIINVSRIGGKNHE